jgi:hypothetical protein
MKEFILNSDLENKDKALAYIETIPEQFRLRFALCLLGKVGGRTLIYMKCADCVSYENVAIRVNKCNSLCCPLRAKRRIRDTSTDALESSNSIAGSILENSDDEGLE